ncbi:MAG: GTPase Era [Alphaproteobacteria bacterium]
MSETRCGFVAVLGLPNAGKSTLVNSLAGGKVSIVSHKAQTTRHRILGITVAGDAQLVLVDTPGVFAPRRQLDRSMVKAAWGARAEADFCLVLVDASLKNLTDNKKLLQKCPGALLVLNKIDRMPRQRLLAVAQELTRDTDVADVFMISALRNDGIDDLRESLGKRVPVGPWVFDADALTDQPQRLWAAELTREQLYWQLNQELPYDTWVETERWENFANGSSRIDQIIYVNREAQKKIVIGARGERIKAISIAARQEMIRHLGAQVHLFLRVKVQENWSEKADIYRFLGLDSSPKVLRQ